MFTMINSVARYTFRIRINRVKKLRKVYNMTVSSTICQ